MTVEELLYYIGIEKIHLDNFAQNNENIKYRLKIEYLKQSPYPYDDQEYLVEKQITNIEINPNEKTITLKGK